MILCPVCSSEVGSAAQLVPCAGCIWEDRAAASTARRRLAALRKDTDRHAYGPDGCSVCPDCRAHFQPKAGLCPLVLLYNAPPTAPPTDEEAEPERFVAEAAEYWDEYLYHHDYPEHVEAYWRRLTQCVEEPAAEQMDG